MQLALIIALFEAATSPKAVTSPMGGNGHNVSFDGRLFIAAHGNGWNATLLRPERIVMTNGFPDVSQGAFTPFVPLNASMGNENGIAMCEETAQPTRCNQDGTPNGAGAYACYEEVIIDSDATAPAPNNFMRRRKLRVVISNPGTSNADIDSFTWVDNSKTPLSTTLRGIEPSVTKDGKLLVWQGWPTNNGDIDTIVYSYNPTPCAQSGWTAPKSITAAYQDPNLVGRYKIADRQLRGADGTLYTSSQVVRAGYPWIFPAGDAINFTAVGMPCRVTTPGMEDPPGCGPRRNALAVIGYLTNWQLAHIDGDVNPDTDQTVRLFFSSPGPLNLSPRLPATAGLDVWPFFGSNTSNYTELVFDDGLDGRYGGIWHLNELVTNAGDFDRTRTADSSGYLNTGRVLGGATFPLRNNGKLGKALALDGLSGRFEVNNSASLNPTSAITVELWLKPASSPDCNPATNNYRLLIGKGNLGGAYSIVVEDDLSFQGRVRVAGNVIYDIRSNGVTAPVGQWTHIAMQYDAASGALAFLVNGTEVSRVQKPPALLTGSTDVLQVGAPGARAACPMTGDGAFHGEIDEVAISRIWRYGTPPTVFVPDAGTGAGGGAGGSGGGMSGAGGGMSGAGGGMSGAGGGTSGTGGGTTGTAGGDGTGGAAGGVSGTGGGVSSGGGGGSTSGPGGGAGGGTASGTGGGAVATGGSSGGGGEVVEANGGCSSAVALLPFAALLPALRRRRRGR